VGGSRNQPRRGSRQLETGFEVYTTARKYDMPGLEKLAKEQIAHLSKGLSAFVVVDVVNVVYPFSTDEDSWFLAYMKRVIKDAFNDPALSEVLVPPENGTQDGFKVSAAKTILRGALEVYREMVEARAVKDAAVAVEMLPPVTNSFQSEGEERIRSTTIAKGKVEKDPNGTSRK
jgi:hypothetical protein